jgi:hypothetical protein
MAEEYPEHSRAVFAYPASYDDTGKCDRLAVFILQGEQAGPVPLGITTGEIADLEAFYPNGHGVSVVLVISFGH